MRKFIAVFALLLAGSGVAWADGISGVQSASNQMLQRTRTVFNDSGSTLTSGAVVVWDNDDTEFDRTGYPYVTTTTTADSVYTAGVTITPSCPDQSLCEISVEGWTWTNVTGSLTEDLLVSTSTTAGRAGDATAGNNVCYLGVEAENFNRETSSTCPASQFCQVPVFVRISCVP